MIKKLTYGNAESLLKVVSDLQDIRDDFPEMVIQTACIRRVTNAGTIEIEVLLIPVDVSYGVQKVDVGCEIMLTA